MQSNNYTSASLYGFHIWCDNVILYAKPKGLFTVLTASHGIKRRGADIENSKLNSGPVMLCHMLHHVHVDGINGSPGLRRLLTCENMLRCVTPTKLYTGLKAYGQGG